MWSIVCALVLVASAASQSASYSGGWVVGGFTQNNCNNICSASGQSTCNVQSMRDLQFAFTFKNVLARTNVTTVCGTSFTTTPVHAPSFNPFAAQCYVRGTIATCGAITLPANFKRVCCCGGTQACPMTAPVRPLLLFTLLFCCAFAHCCLFGSLLKSVLLLLIFF